MKRKISLIRVEKWFETIVLFLFLGLSIQMYGQEKQVPAIPQYYFTDYTSSIDKIYGDSINEVLADLEKVTGNQFLVVIDSSLQGEVLETYVNKVFNTWKLGQAKKDNGLLLMVFLEDRAFRLEVGYGLEGRLPDALCRKIQDNQLIPYFKEGRYEEGLLRYVEQVADFSASYAMGFGKRDFSLMLFKERLYDPEGLVTNYSDYYFDYTVTDPYSGYWYGKSSNYFFVVTNNKENLELSAIAADRRNRIKEIFPDMDRVLIFVHDVAHKKYFFTCDDVVKADLPKDYSFGNIAYSTYQQVDQLLEEGNTRELFRNLTSQVYFMFEYQVFRENRPYYTGLMEIFFDRRMVMHDEFGCWFFFSQGAGLILFSSLCLFLVLIIPFTTPRHRNVSLFWILLNILFPIFGVVIQLVYFIRLVLLWKFSKSSKDKFKKRMEYIDDTGYPGWWALLEGGSGGYSGGTFNSKGWTSSSRSYSSSSSSSSSSSRSSFSGGGGGRSGGGGSSGRW